MSIHPPDHRLAAVPHFAGNRIGAQPSPLVQGSEPCGAVRVAVLAYFPTRSDLPGSFHSAAAAERDFVVQVDSRADMAWHHPDFLSDVGRPMDLHVAVLLIQFAQGPWAPDEVAERTGTDRLIARERFWPGVDHALARHRGAHDRGEHPERAVRLDAELRLEAARVIEDVGPRSDLGCPRNQRRFPGTWRRTSGDNRRLEARRGERIKDGVDPDARRLEAWLVEPRRPKEDPPEIRARLRDLDRLFG